LEDGFKISHDTQVQITDSLLD